MRMHAYCKWKMIMIILLKVVLLDILPHQFLTNYHPDDHQPYDQCVNHDQYGNQDLYRSFDQGGHHC